MRWTTLIGAFGNLRSGFLITAFTETANRLYLSDIRVAIASGQRPTAVILRDAYALHRILEPHWHPDRHATEWTDWDYALLSAYQLLDDYTDNRNGQLIWRDQDEYGEWLVESRYSYHDAAVEEAQNNRKEKRLDAGERLFARYEPDPEHPATLKSFFERLGKEEEFGPAGAAKVNAGSVTEDELLNVREQQLQKRKELAEKRRLLSLEDRG